MATFFTEVPLYRLDADRYGRIVESGALDDLRVELIDGLIVGRAPHSPPHALLIERLTKRLLSVRLRLRVQLPILIGSDSVPEPDLAIVAEPASMRYHPESALLAVEVAHSSHALDRGRKAELYAAAGIPTYWLVDIPARAVEVRTDPGPAGYRTLRTLEPGDTLLSPCDGIADLAVDELFAGI